jgi:hypothetical protein
MAISHWVILHLTYRTPRFGLPGLNSDIMYLFGC